MDERSTEYVPPADPLSLITGCEYAIHIPPGRSAGGLLLSPRAPLRQRRSPAELNGISATQPVERDTVWLMPFTIDNAASRANALDFRVAHCILHHFTRTAMPVSTNAPAHSQSMLNQALRRMLRPSFRYTIHAASTITVRYAAV